MVWLIPSAEAARFHVVTLMTYLIALGGFTHVVAGSVEAFLLLVNRQLWFWPMVAGFTFPVLLGNVVGGTGDSHFCIFTAEMRPYAPVSAASQYARRRACPPTCSGGDPSASPSTGQRNPTWASRL